MKVRRLVVVLPLLITVGCLAAVKGVTEYGVPAVKVTEGVIKAVRYCSEYEEYYIGRSVAARILASYPLLDDARLTEYVNLIGLTVALNSDKPWTYGGYHFAVLDTDEINALSCPGGIIFLSRGIINLTRNEDELAAVIAHEVAHVNSRDGLAAVKSASWTRALAIIGTAAAANLYDSQALTELVDLFGDTVQDVVTMLVVNGYSREQERLADAAALSYLKRTGYRASALTDFLKRLACGVPAGGLLKTHPDTAARIKHLESKLSQETTDNALFDFRKKRHDAVLNRS